MLKPMRVAALLLLSTLAAALAVGVATFYHYGVLSIFELCCAYGIVAFGCIPPLWFSKAIQGPAKQLAVVGWRFSSLLPALLMIRSLDSIERICFLYGLVACYFVGLSLESWHFIREASEFKESRDSY